MIKITQESIKETIGSDTIETKEDLKKVLVEVSKGLPLNDASIDDDTKRETLNKLWDEQLKSFIDDSLIDDFWAHYQLYFKQYY